MQRVRLHLLSKGAFLEFVAGRGVILARTRMSRRFLHLRNPLVILVWTIGRVELERSNKS